ncbi:MAG: MATE family efflux transporter [Flavobacteriales bacterium]|nr:MATE family efflux transporter [Flavobacteriales bacterium]
MVLKHETGKRRIRKLLITGWPIIVGQVGMVLMGVADTVMVGKLGYVALAAAGLSVSIFFLIGIFGIGLMSATASLVSSARARGHEETLPAFFRDSFLLSMITSFMLFLITVFVVKLLPYFGQEQEVVKLAGPYLLIIAFSMIPFLGYMSGKNLCDGYYLTLSPMMITFAALGLNIFLNWLLIYGKLGFPALGLNGAGWATLISRVFMLVLVLWYIFRSKKLNFKLKDVLDRNFKVNFFKPILKLGVPSGFQYLFEIAAFSGAAILAGVIGAVEQAAHQIAINIASFTFMFAIGISVSGSVYVAENYAHNNLRGARMYGISALWLVAFIEFVFAILFILLHELLPVYYTQNKEVIEIASKLILIAAVFQVVDGIQAVSLGLLRGIHDTRMPSLFTFIAYWVIGLPLSFYLGLNTSLGIYGLWWSLTISLTFICISTAWRFRMKTKTLMV